MCRARIGSPCDARQGSMAAACLHRFLPRYLLFGAEGGECCPAFRRTVGEDVKLDIGSMTRIPAQAAPSRGAGACGGLRLRALWGAAHQQPRGTGLATLGHLPKGLPRDTKRKRIGKRGSLRQRDRDGEAARMLHPRNLRGPPHRTARNGPRDPFPRGGEGRVISAKLLPLSMHSEMPNNDNNEEGDQNHNNNNNRRVISVIRFF